jgi:hypothetical protein
VKCILRTSIRMASNNALNLTKRNCKRKNGRIISFAFRKLTRCWAGVRQILGAEWSADTGKG